MLIGKWGVVLTGADGMSDEVLDTIMDRLDTIDFNTIVQNALAEIGISAQIVTVNDLNDL